METNDDTVCQPPNMDPQCVGLPLDARAYEVGPAIQALLRELLEEQSRKLKEEIERAKNPHRSIGPYYYAVTLTVPSALNLEQQKAKLLKMLHTLLRGKSIAKKYEIREEECYYVWELTKAKVLHVHLLVKSGLPVKDYDIRKVKGLETVNWQLVRNRYDWIKYLEKNIYDEEHIQTKNKLAILDKLPNGLEIQETKGKAEEDT